MAAVGIIKCSKIQSISNKFSHIQTSHFNTVKMLLRKYALFTEISIQNCSVFRNVCVCVRGEKDKKAHTHREKIKKEMNKERVSEWTNYRTNKRMSEKKTHNNNNWDSNSSLEL